MLAILPSPGKNFVHLYQLIGATKDGRPGDQRPRERLERFHDAITEGLATNTAQTVWQRLHDERGLDVSVRTFRRYVQEGVEGVRRARVRVRQPATPLAEVAEVDYGRLGQVRSRDRQIST